MNAPAPDITSTPAPDLLPEEKAPTAEGAPAPDNGVAPDAPPIPSPIVEPPPVAPSPKKRGGKRKGAGRPKGGKKKKAATSPFTAAGEDAPKGEVPTELPIGDFADMKHVATVATAAVDGLIVGVARLRYGEKAGALHPDKRAVADIQAAMTVWLELSALKITPGQALLVAIGAAYGPPMIALEMDKRAEVKLDTAKPAGGS